MFLLLDNGKGLNLEGYWIKKHRTKLHIASLYDNNVKNFVYHR